MPGRLISNPRKFLFVCIVTDDVRLDAAATALGDPAISVITSCLPDRIGPFSESFGITHVIVDERVASPRDIREGLSPSIEVRGAETPDAVLGEVRALVEEAQRLRSADGALDGGALRLVGDPATQRGEVVLEVRDLGGGGDGTGHRRMSKDPE